MLKKFVKDYLTFTKADRIGVLVLVAVILFIFVLPAMWPAAPFTSPDKAEMAVLQAAAAQLSTPSDSDQTIAHSTPSAFSARRTAEEKETSAKAKTFYFDPNTIDQAGWQQLGLREKTAITIIKYRSKGGQFRKPEDISKIFGLSEADYQRLLPYVRIENKQSPRADSNWKTKPNGYAQPQTRISVPKPKLVIDINTADTSAWIALPGIGARLATRIINFRDKLGGFYRVEQVGETYGVPDSTFNLIRSLLVCNSPQPKKININTADANTLRQHPYIRWAIANAIVQYRQQHGDFKSTDELQQLAVITPEIFEKLKAYVTVE